MTCLIALGAGAGTAVALGWLVSLWTPDRSGSAQIAHGRELYRRHCASCDGARSEGQPTWQESLPNGRKPAPPHDVTGHTWHHSDGELLLITNRGMAALVPGHESDMPAFEGVLADDDIRAILGFIKSAWPEREQQDQPARTEGTRWKAPRYAWRTTRVTGCSTAISRRTRQAA